MRTVFSPWSAFSEFDRMFQWLDDARRQADSGDADGDFGAAALSSSVAAPPLHLFDKGNAWLVTADVPGMAEGDFNLTVHNDTLTVSGKRNVEAPDGYAARRRERASLSFSRTVALPTKVDAERTHATLKDGVLTVLLAKSPDATPRQISVTAG